MHAKYFDMMMKTDENKDEKNYKSISTGVFKTTLDKQKYVAIIARFTLIVYGRN